MSIENVTVVGAGTMGNGIAHVCAQNDRSVRLVDAVPEQLDRALHTIAGNLDRQIRKGLLEEGDKEVILGRIRPVARLEDGLEGADLVVEAVPERLELKREIFQVMDESTPRQAILASNTSSISITRIASFTGRPERVIGMHFMNPVPVMKLVEIIRGLATSDEVTEAVTSLARELGKVPVHVNDYPGFISNRVLMPMINEAVFCVMEGVAEPEAVDSVMKLGMNHPLGPLALADLIGLDTCLAILEVLHQELGEDKYRPAPLLRKYVAAGWLGRKVGRGFFDYSA